MNCAAGARGEGRKGVFCAALSGKSVFSCRTTDGPDTGGVRLTGESDSAGVWVSVTRGEARGTAGTRRTRVRFKPDLETRGVEKRGGDVGPRIISIPKRLRATTSKETDIGGHTRAPNHGRRAWTRFSRHRPRTATNGTGARRRGRRTRGGDECGRREKLQFADAVSEVEFIGTFMSPNRRRTALQAWPGQGAPLAL